MSDWRVYVQYKGFEFEVWIGHGSTHAKCLGHLRRRPFTLVRDPLGRWLLADLHMLRGPDDLLAALDNAHRYLMGEWTFERMAVSS